MLCVKIYRSHWDSMCCIAELSYYNCQKKAPSHLTSCTMYTEMQLTAGIFPDSRGETIIRKSKTRKILGKKKEIAGVQRIQSM